MMNNYITFRSVTFAQKAERAMRRAGIDCILQRTPKILSRRGCGYCLRFRPDYIYRAKGILDAEHLEYGKCYSARPDGSFQELEL